jgi:hypothetical protein
MSDVARPTKVVFYFPWREVSGGPYFLTRLADQLSLDSRFEVYYTDYEFGLSDDLLKSDAVQKIVVSEKDFGIKTHDPVTLVVPIYWACWLPQMHPDSKILFFNWHNCCIPVLKSTWGITENYLSSFLKLVRDTSSVFFCDYSHWLAQNTRSIIFERKYVPITLPAKRRFANPCLVHEGEINIGILGRLCADKIHSVINVLQNLNAVDTPLKKRVHIIGDGPEKPLIDIKKYPETEIIFEGTVTGETLDELLCERLDLLFGMGTSVLEGAAAKLPSVVIPHNMQPMACDANVYLQDSKGYCLGWYDTQIDEIGLATKTLQMVINDVYVEGKKHALGEAAYEYYTKHHTIESAGEKFKHALETTALNYEAFLHITKKVYIKHRRYKFFGINIAQVHRNEVGTRRIKVLGVLPMFTIDQGYKPNLEILKFFGIPVLRIKSGTSKVEIKPYIPRARIKPVSDAVKRALMQIRSRT